MRGRIAPRFYRSADYTSTDGTFGRTNLRLLINLERRPVTRLLTRGSQVSCSRRWAPPRDRVPVACRILTGAADE